MSEIESHKGKLREFKRTEGESDESYIDRYFKHRGVKKPDIFRASLMDIFSEMSYQDGVLHKGTIYEIVEIDGLEAREIFQSSRRPDGDIDFTIQFCGCSFDKAMGYALDNVVE